MQGKKFNHFKTWYRPAKKKLFDLFLKQWNVVTQLSIGSSSLRVTSDVIVQSVHFLGITVPSRVGHPVNGQGLVVLGNLQL